MPFAVTKSRYKRWFNNSICEGEDYDIGDCMKELVSIIMKLDNDIWLNAWKRSGLIADYLNELDSAERGIVREECTFEEDIDLFEEAEEEPEKQKEPENSANNEEIEILDRDIINMNIDQIPKPLKTENCALRRKGCKHFKDNGEIHVFGVSMG